MPTTETEFITNTWTYAGQRLGADKKLFHVWIDPDGEERNFNAGRGESYSVGGQYALESTADYSRVRLGGARYAGAGDHANAAEWVAKDRAAKAHKQHAAAEAAAKRAEAEALDGLTLAEARKFIRDGIGPAGAARMAVVLQRLGVA